MLPRLQISATQSYPISCITSGAIQYGVPITVFRFAIVSCNNYAMVNRTVYNFIKYETFCWKTPSYRQLPRNTKVSKLGMALCVE